MSNDEKYEPRVPKFYGNTEDDFHPWSVQARAALKEKELLAAVTDESVDLKMNERALALIIMALGDNLQRCIRECKAAK